jgi:hypothetical protein
LASGNTNPARIIQGQKTKLTRAAHGITYDKARDLILASEPLAAAIVTFPAGAHGEVAPLRVLQGPKTQLHRPFQLEVDDVHKELVVADSVSSRILFYRWDASGNTPPLRYIGGPKTGMYGGVIGVAVDPVRNIVVGTASDQHHRGAIFVFDRRASGDVAPLGVITGPHTGIKSLWHVAVYNGKIFAVAFNSGYFPPYDRGGFAPTPGCTGPPKPWLAPIGFIGVWNLTDKGDVPPRAYIRGAASDLLHPASIALDPPDGELFTGDGGRNGVFAFQVPQLLGVPGQGGLGSGQLNDTWSR